jgi:transcriptional regulator with XRE-family HTH domain
MARSIGEVLRSAVRGAGVTQEALAETVGLSRTVLTRFRQGAGLNLDTIERLAAHFGFVLVPRDRVREDAAAGR